MSTSFNFEIKSNAPVSAAFRKMGLSTFTQASQWVRQIPYGRNSSKIDLLLVFTEKKGTCSTKHGLLKLLAEENGEKRLQLCMGIFNMNPTNTPAISSVFEKYHLTELPEAHCYLKYEDEILDFTWAQADPSAFTKDLIIEENISPEQIGEYKINQHQKHLLSWLSKTEQTGIKAEQIWSIREACIATLETHWRV
jgi:hypothetical protein